MYSWIESGGSHLDISIVLLFIWGKCKNLGLCSPVHLLLHLYCNLYDTYGNPCLLSASAETKKHFKSYSSVNIAIQSKW